MPKVFLAAPFSDALNEATGILSAHLREELEVVIHFLRKNGVDVWSAHEVEKMGAVKLSPEVFTPRDYTQMSHCDVVVALFNGMASGGVNIELGWASATAKPIVIAYESTVEVPCRWRGLSALTCCRLLPVEGTVKKHLHALLEGILKAFEKPPVQSESRLQLAPSERIGREVYVTAQKYASVLGVILKKHRWHVVAPALMDLDSRDQAITEGSTRRDFMELQGATCAIAVLDPPKGDVNVDLGWISQLKKPCTVFVPQNANVTPLLGALHRIHVDYSAIRVLRFQDEEALQHKLKALMENLEWGYPWQKQLS